MGAIEAKTYLPDAFFANHAPDLGWAWMQRIYNTIGDTHPIGKLINGDYPEVSFTLVGQTVQGLLGLTLTAGQTLTTYAEVPSTVGWLQVAGIPIGNGTITLRQDGQTGSTLSNTSTGTTYTWHVRFPGSHTGITVNGSSVTSTVIQPDGRTYTEAIVTAHPADTLAAQVAG